ncbi:response regulator [Pseudorhizobium pelagicum]|uniref:response regulator n=1 Tax=Pseudorhizobium pelagicum TaxID=1509405 RepID=UPI0024780610|nr:response regulator [Pseudorhizobium pelagicum]
MVEDEPLIRMDVAEYVNETGFSALEAAAGDEALAILSARTDIDVVFTDVNMPGEIGGMELARRIADRWPQIGVIITSGMVRPRSADLSPRWLFFSKPYDLEHVVNSMRRLAA